MEECMKDSGRTIKCTVLVRQTLTRTVKSNFLGKLTWPDGRIYEGEYKDDKKDGQGTFIWADNRKYIGGWKEGRQHGQGKYITATGKVQVGIWVEGKRKSWIE